MEVVSDDLRKAHNDLPERYASLGVRELLIFDPKAERRRPRAEGPS